MKPHRRKRKKSKPAEAAPAEPIAEAAPAEPAPIDPVESAPAAGVYDEVAPTPPAPAEQPVAPSAPVEQVPTEPAPAAGVYDEVAPAPPAPAAPAEQAPVAPHQPAAEQAPPQADYSGVYDESLQPPPPAPEPEQPAASAGVYEESVPAPPPVDPNAGAAPAAAAGAAAAGPTMRTRGSRRGPNSISTSTRRGAPRRKVNTPADSKKGSRRPGYGGRPNKYNAPAPKESVSIFSVLMGVVAIGLVVLVGMFLAPKNLSFIQGYPAANAMSGNGGKPRNLLAEGQAVMNKAGAGTLTYSEEEVNRYLNQRLNGQQGGILGALVKFKGVYVDLDQDMAEFYIERSMLGLPLTMSSRVKVQRFRGEVMWKAAGGTIGKFNMNSRQLQPIVRAFTGALVNLEDEIDLLNHMADVKFEKDKIKLVVTPG